MTLAYSQFKVRSLIGSNLETLKLKILELLVKNLYLALNLLLHLRLGMAEDGKGRLPETELQDSPKLPEFHCAIYCVLYSLYTVHNT